MSKNKQKLSEKARKPRKQLKFVEGWAKLEMLQSFLAIDLYFLSDLAICPKGSRGFDYIRTVFHVVEFCYSRCS